MFLRLKNELKRIKKKKNIKRNFCVTIYDHFSGVDFFSISFNFVSAKLTKREDLSFLVSFANANYKNLF